MTPYGLRRHAWPWLLLDLVVPTACFGCGARLGAVQSRGACPRCWEELRPPGPLRREVAVLPAVDYGPAARRFLLRAKFGHRRELFVPMGGMILACVRLAGITASCVVPVPSHPWSTLVRGFSPARELSRVVAGGLGVPIREALGRRWIAGTPLKRLSRAGRRGLARRLFHLRRPLSGERVLLVDDLLTTGATIEVCSRLCRAGGASTTTPVVWARAPADH